MSEIYWHEGERERKRQSSIVNWIPCNIWRLIDPPSWKHFPSIVHWHPKSLLFPPQSPIFQAQFSLSSCSGRVLFCLFLQSTLIDFINLDFFSFRNYGFYLITPTIFCKIELMGKMIKWILFKFESWLKFQKSNRHLPQWNG